MLLECSITLTPYYMMPRFLKMGVKKKKKPAILLSMSRHLNSPLRDYITYGEAKVSLWL